MEHGLNPTKKKGSDYDFHGTFGTTGSIPAEYDVDAGFGLPDQNADGYPEACTGYATTEICQDQDKVRYDPSYTYLKTLYMEDQPLGSPCDMRDSLKSAIVYGLHRVGETDDNEYASHKGNYFNVGRLNDWFDGFTSAMTVMGINGEKRSISIGTPWFPEWSRTGSDGILAMPAIPTNLLGGVSGALARLFGGTSSIPWHDYKASGWTAYNTKGQPIRGGETFFRMKTWQGTHFGDNGWCYMSRAVLETVMNVPGTAAFTITVADPGDIATVRLFTLQTILLYLQRELNLLRGV